MLEVGATLQRGYTIEKVLGKGGMGAVYLARHATLSRRVAIKETTLHLDNPEDQLRAGQQFRQEAEILASLEHPNLVDVKDFFEEAGSWYLVMSFVDGDTLETIVNDAPTHLPLDQVLDWADQLCEVLIYLHEHQPPVIVRDLKPNNIMLDSRDRIRVIDFGIARVYEAGSETAMFVKGAGTVGFAPVEQFGGGTTDPRTDLYSLGATLYALMTRTLPPWSVAIATGEASLVAPSVANPRITPPLEAVLLRLMALRKEQRYQTAREAREALARVRQGLADDPIPHVAVPQRFCTNCGCTLLPHSSQCPRCGKPLSGASGGLLGSAASPQSLPGHPSPGVQPGAGPQASPSYPPPGRQPGGGPQAPPSYPPPGMPPGRGPQAPPSYPPPGRQPGGGAQGPPSYPPPGMPPGGGAQGPPSYPPQAMPPGRGPQAPPSYPPPAMPSGGGAQAPPSYPPQAMPPGRGPQAPPSYPPPGMPPGGGAQAPPSYPPQAMPPGRGPQAPPSYPPSLASPPQGLPPGAPPARSGPFPGPGSPPAGPGGHAGPVVAPAALPRGPAPGLPPGWTPPAPRPPQPRPGLPPALIFILVVAVALLVWGMTVIFSGSRPATTKSPPPSEDSSRVRVRTLAHQAHGSPSQPERALIPSPHGRPS